VAHHAVLAGERYGIFILGRRSGSENHWQDQDKEP
jgi:hypothetical protein